jgi:DNA-binding CsgD family transcriptional regulator
MLLGRDRERLLIDALVDAARAGTSGVLAIVGDVGIGKSALLRYAETRAEGMRVLKARGVQTEAHIPFAGLFELLRPALGVLPQLPPPQAAALEAALALRPAQSLDRFAVGAATLSLLAAYAEVEPVAVLVDDAHWLDGSSASSLLFAIRRLIADPVAVMLTVRQGEASLLDGTDLPTLHLQGLDQEAAARLVRRHARQPVSNQLADWLYRETGGNPLALVELGDRRPVLDDLAPGAPPIVASRVASAYTRRVRALPERTRQVLVLAASSHTDDIALLARAAASLGWDLADLVPAESAGLIRILGGRVEFAHPLIRSAIYADAAPDERRLVHRTLAAVLPEAEGDRRAWHLALAALGPDHAVASALERAGDRARARSAYDLASRAFERGARLAVDEDHQARLLFAAADAAWLGGLAERAEQLLSDARRHAATPSLLIQIDQLRGHIATRRGPIQEAQMILLDAGRQAVEVDPERAVAMFAEAALAAFYAGDTDAMQRAVEPIGAIRLEQPAARTAFVALLVQGMACIFSGDGERGAALVRDATAVLEASDDLRNDPRLLAWAAMGPAWLREVHTGRALAERALNLARRQAAVGVLPFVLTYVALDQAASDRWDAAGAAFHEAIELARESGQRTELTVSLARLAWLEARQGRVDASRQHGSEALALAREVGLGLCEVWALTAGGELELALGQPGRALLALESQRAALVARGIGDVDLSPAPELVELYLRFGRRQDAVEAADAYTRLAEIKGQPWALARAARAQGLLAVDEAEVEMLLERALALHRATPDVFELARTHLVYGSQLRRGRQRVRAREQLRTALDLFDRIGAEPWSELTRAELSATGETPRRRVAATLNELTPQELRVAMRIAEGRTTRETASALFLSPKTIEYHLRSIYRKLAIATRQELAAALRRLDASGAAADIS